MSTTPDKDAALDDIFLMFLSGLPTTADQKHIDYLVTRAKAAIQALYTPTLQDQARHTPFDGAFNGNKLKGETEDYVTASESPDQSVTDSPKTYPTGQSSDIRQQLNDRWDYHRHGCKGHSCFDYEEAERFLVEAAALYAQYAAMEVLAARIQVLQDTFRECHKGTFEDHLKYYDAELAALRTPKATI